MNEQHRIFESYLEEQIAACNLRGALLTADGRPDEGNFEKIRANIYEIFKTILPVSEKVHEKDDSAKKDFFLQKTGQIPKDWADSYEKARQHGDDKKMHIERIKLDTAREIKDTYLKIWEETA